MQHRIAMCAGLIALGAFESTTAQAQYYYDRYDRGHYQRGFWGAPMFEPGLPASEVMMIVRSAGLRPLTRPARRGPRYVLLASDHMGGQLQVVVSAYDGRIVRVSPAYDPRFASPARPHGLVPIPGSRGAATPPMHPQRGAVPPHIKDPPPVIYGSRNPPPDSDGHPPRAGGAPDERIATAPPTADPAPPRRARTPLPRPRPPALASTQAAPSETSPEAETAVPPASSPAATPRPVAPAAPAAKSRPPVQPTELVPVAPLE